MNDTPITDTDEDLVHLAQDGDTKAFDEVVKRHYNRLVGLLMSKLQGDEPSARDILQKSLVKVWNKIGLYDFSHPFVKWLNTIVINQLTDDIRGNERRSKLYDRFEVALRHNDHTKTDGTTDYMGDRWHDMRQLVLSVIADLSPRDAQLMRLRLLDGLTSLEIAERFEKPVGTVKAQIRRVILKIQGDSRIVAHVSANKNSTSAPLDES